jgi:hypothetical protein
MGKHSKLKKRSGVFCRNGLWLPTQYMVKLAEVSAAAAAAASPAAAGGTPPAAPYYKCVKKNQSRAGFEMASDKVRKRPPLFGCHFIPIMPLFY